MRAPEAHEDRPSLERQQIPLGSEARKVVAAEVPQPERQRRGRAFVTAYIVLLLAAAVGFIALALVVRGNDVVSAIDVPVTRAIQSVRAPLYGWVLTHTSDLGWLPLNVVSYVVVFAALFVLRLRVEAVVAVAASVLAGLLGGGIKLLIHRLRPSDALVHVVARLGGFSFPSGHVIQYTTLFGFTFWVVWVTWRSSWPRNLTLAVLFLPVALVGPSRVYLGEHWPSDVAGAYLLSGLWLAGTIELMLALKPRLNGWWAGRAPRRRWT